MNSAAIIKLNTGVNCFFLMAMVYWSDKRQYRTVASGLNACLHYAIAISKYAVIFYPVPTRLLIRRTPDVGLSLQRV